jgi:hypothetical protein
MPLAEAWIQGRTHDSANNSSHSLLDQQFGRATDGCGSSWPGSRGARRGRGMLVCRRVASLKDADR